MMNLSLQKQSITHLGESAFYGLDMIQLLDLSYNKITSIHLNTFKDLKTLVKLDVSHNNITKIDYSVFGAMPSLSVVDCDDQPLCCISNKITICQNNTHKSSSCSRIIGNKGVLISIFLLAIIAVLSNLSAIVIQIRGAVKVNISTIGLILLSLLHILEQHTWTLFCADFAWCGRNGNCYEEKNNLHFPSC